MRIVALASIGLLLAGCGGGGGGSSTPHTTSTVGPLTTSPTSPASTPIVLSVSGCPGGTAQSTPFTFTQTGLSSLATFNIVSTTCFTKGFGPTDILGVSAGATNPTFSNGTETVTANLTAKSVGSCSFTTTSTAGSQSVTAYFKVTP